MSKKTSKYYLKNVEKLGWDEKETKLDIERQELLKKYILGKKVLDVGCGFGFYVDYLESMNYEAYGLDFTKKFIESASKNKKGKFLKGDAEHLPFPDNFFDSVLLFDILEHGNDRKILYEAKRVSKGRIIIIVPRVVDRILEQSGVIFRHYLDKSHIREYEENDIKNLAKQIGLKIINLQTIHPLYNETIFLNLFRGSLIWKKLIRKIVFILLRKQIYPTEYFAVFE